MEFTSFLATITSSAVGAFIGAALAFVAKSAFDLFKTKKQAEYQIKQAAYSAFFNKKSELCIEIYNLKQDFLYKKNDVMVQERAKDACSPSDTIEYVIGEVMYKICKCIKNNMLYFSDNLCDEFKKFEKSIKPKLDKVNVEEYHGTNQYDEQYGDELVYLSIYTTYYQNKSIAEWDNLLSKIDEEFRNFTKQYAL